jgi:hypothetical protein
MFSPEALAAFREFRRVDEATRVRAQTTPAGAYDASMPMRDDEPANNTARKLLSSFASKLPAADRAAFRQAIDQAFPLGPYDELDEPSENPYAKEPDEDEPVGYTEDDDLGGRFNAKNHPGMTKEIGGPRRFEGMPKRGGELASDSYSEAFSAGRHIKLDPIVPQSTGRRSRREQMAFDQSCADGDALASYEKSFPMAARIGLLP